jgi:hypothetical protein
MGEDNSDRAGLPAELQTKGQTLSTVLESTQKLVADYTQVLSSSRSSKSEESTLHQSAHRDEGK